ncbi:MAG TPA: efflux RND transporter periplasmic adaptor subunit [Pirellulales bacterium]|jgi:HlyD family secretion protein|nr:efflux RND transporter periplasmic adaptor subunit [Pirellulales bacterium]
MQRNLFIALNGLAMLLAGCGPPAAAVPPPAGAARVAVVAPVRKTLKYTVEEPGQIEGFEEAPLYAKLAAYVAKVSVDIGSQVKEGDVLAQLSIPELQKEYDQKVAAVKQAKAAVAQAQAAVAVARAAVTSSKAKLDEAEATIERTDAEYQRWQSEYGRMAELADKGSITRKAADEAHNQFRAADAARNESASIVKSAKAIVGESEAKELASVADEAGAEAKVLAAEADQAHAKALLEYTEIRAPFAGVVTRRNVHPGHFVQPAEAGGGKPLFAVARTDLLRVIVYVPETDAPFVSVDDHAEIRVPAMANKVFAAQVKRTSVALDMATRTLRVEMDLKNDERIWRPGLYIYVDLTIERPDVLTVPTAAVFVEAGQSFCAAVTDGKIERKAVEVGIRSGGDVQIISGLKATDQIVAKDAANFRPGQAAEPLAAEQIAPTTAQTK